MMQDKRFFVYSVIIALVVPAIIGTLYFCRLSKDYSKDSYVARMSESEEILILGDTSDNIIDENTKVLEFLVMYSSGKKDFINYRLSLESLHSLQGLDWNLYREMNNRYEKIASGYIDDKSLTVSLIPYNSIQLKDSHKYKLYIKSKNTIKNINIVLQKE